MNYFLALVLHSLGMKIGNIFCRLALKVYLTVIHITRCIQTIVMSMHLWCQLCIITFTWYHFQGISVLLLGIVVNDYIILSSLLQGLAKTSSSYKIRDQKQSPFETFVTHYQSAQNNDSITLLWQPSYFVPSVCGSLKLRHGVTFLNHQRWGLL